MSKGGFWKIGDSLPLEQSSSKTASQPAAAPTARETRGPGMSEKLAGMRFMAKRLDAEKRKLAAAALSSTVAAAAAATAEVADSAARAREARIQGSAAAERGTDGGADARRPRLVCIADRDSTIFAATEEDAVHSSRRSFGKFNAALESQASGNAARTDVTEAEMAKTLARRSGSSGAAAPSGPRRHAPGAKATPGGLSFSGFKRPRQRAN